MKKNEKIVKNVLMAFVIIAVALQLPSCKKKTEADVTAIVVGTGQKYEPYCYLDANGNLVGFEKAVLDEVDKRLPQYAFTYEMFDFPSVLISLGAGKVDIGAHEFEENPDRRRTYLYGEEGYNDYNGYIAVLENGPYANVTSIEDFAGKPDAVLGVSAGSNYEAFVKTYNKNHPDKPLAFKVYGDDEVRIHDITNGKTAGAILIRYDVIKYNALQNAGLISRGEPVIISKAYFIFNKNNPALQQAVDGALREMKADGTLERIQQEKLTNYYASLQ
ncbi:MAG: transporter substrate-binding domain-containing protein [Spirochaetaceae bacterium]|jgi:L-cystine transport system substrate-binding protein|nr:transporter substrate-binding domain-containing protein [Spirochaetaceae bacterium]